MERKVMLWCLPYNVSIADVNATVARVKKSMKDESPEVIYLPTFIENVAPKAIQSLEEATDPTSEFEDTIARGRLASNILDAIELVAPAIVVLPNDLHPAVMSSIQSRLEDRVIHAIGRDQITLVFHGKKTLALPIININSEEV